MAAMPIALGSQAHVGVVGAGVFGSWTAEHLRRAGHRVTLVDPWGPAHARSSSGGESRMTRAAYGKDAIYSRMALDSLPEWKALSDRAGLPGPQPRPQQRQERRDGSAVQAPLLRVAQRVAGEGTRTIGCGPRCGQVSVASALPSVFQSRP